MAIFIGAALALLSIAVVIYPFLKPRILGGPGVPQSGEDLGNHDLEAIYEAIRTLQLEHQLGNIPQGLYREQLDAYRLQAAAALKQQMESRPQDEDWRLEQEIGLARASLGRMNGQTASCPNCGAAVGTALGQCPECSAETSPTGQPPEGGAER